MVSFAVPPPAGAKDRTPGAARPLWISQPKSDDSMYLYRIGQATGAATEEDARAAAFMNALERLAMEILSTLEIEGDTAVLRSHIEFQGAEILPHAMHMEAGEGGYSCWVQVSFPRTEKDRVLAEVEAGRQLERTWEAAQAAFLRGDFGEAQAGLLSVLNATGGLAYARFDSDEAKKMLGDTYREQKDYLEARRWYDQLANLSEAPAYREAARTEIEKLPEPPMLWPMRDRWQGRKVGLVCGIRDGDGLRSFDAMTRILRRELHQARLDSTDLGKSMDEADLEDLLDIEILSGLDEAFDADEAGVVLAVLYDINPAKASGIDTVVRYLVIDGASRAVVDRNQFKEMTGTQSPDRMAARCAEILARRYLVPKSPAL